MLPFGAQGANQAIEDAGALGILLRGVQAGTEVRQRLELFEKIRHKRASVIQILSSVRIGQEKTVKEALQPYMDCDTDSQCPIGDETLVPNSQVSRSAGKLPGTHRLYSWVG